MLYSNVQIVLRDTLLAMPKHRTGHEKSEILDLAKTLRRGSLACGLKVSAPRPYAAGAGSERRVEISHFGTERVAPSGSGRRNWPSWTSLTANQSGVHRMSWSACGTEECRSQ